MGDEIELAEHPKRISKKNSKSPEKPPTKKKEKKRKIPFRIPSKLLASIWWIIFFVTFIIGTGGLIYVISKIYIRRPLDWSYALIIVPYYREVHMVVYYVKDSSRDIIVRLEDQIIFGYHIETQGVDYDLRRNFKAAQKMIPWLSRSSSPVIFAGGDVMRNIRNYNKKYYNLLMNDIRNMLKKSRLKFLPHYMKTLDKWEEALHGWIATNYLSNFLSKPEWNEIDTQGLPCYPQIDDYTPPWSHYKTLGSTYLLYSNKHFLLESCSRTPAVEKAFNETRLIKTPGNTDAEKCLTHIKDMMKKCAQNFKHFDCPDFVFPARTYNVTFTGFNEFAEFAILAGLKNGDDKKTWNAKRTKICGTKSMNSLQITHPNRISFSTISRKKAYEFLCIAITFLYHILDEKIKLTNEEWKKLRIDYEVDNTRITWLLGYVLNVTNSLPTTSPFHELFTLRGIFIEGITFAGILTVSSVALSVALRNSNTLVQRPLQPCT